MNKHKQQPLELLADLLSKYIALSDTERLIFDAAYQRHVKHILKQKDYEIQS